MMTRVCAVMCLSLLGGCATNFSPDLPATHPANPSAEAAQPEAPSTVLAIGTAGPAGSADAEAPPGTHHAGAATAQTGSTAFVCPMHPRVTSSDPNAKCPECGMKINKPVKPAASKPSTGAQLHVCPMHPKVTSTDPNAECPECGMKINKPVKGAATAAAASQSAPATAPALQSPAAGHEHH